MMNCQGIAESDSLIGPLFDKLTAKVTHSGNGPYIINFDFFTKVSILLLDLVLGPDSS